jgi:hypothetical protein
MKVTAKARSAGPGEIDKLRAALAPAPSVMGGGSSTQLDRIEAKLDALLAHYVQPRLNGTPLHRCACGRLATRMHHVNHPYMGTRSQHACDDCGPTGEVYAFSAAGGTLVTTNSPADVVTHARRVNGLIGS